MSDQNLKSELTICSAYHSSETKKLLELNMDLTARMNSSQNWAWFVAENTPSGFTDKIDRNKFVVFPGVALPPFAPKEMAASFYIALALNQFRPHIRSRFVLFLDSDFFLVRPEWIRDVIDHMKANDLALLGSPWHPRWIKKIRYFPAEHALFVDLDKINIQEMDFMPEPERKIAVSGDCRTGAELVLFLLSKLLLPRELKKSIQGRLQIGTSRDVGYRIYERYYGDKRIRFECLAPVFRPHVGMSRRKVYAKKLLKPILPDRWSYIPTRAGYYTETGFREFNHPDSATYGWEEFMWRGHPFGFHMRRTQKDKERTKKDGGHLFSNEFSMLYRVLRSFDVSAE